MNIKILSAMQGVGLIVGLGSITGCTTMVPLAKAVAQAVPGGQNMSRALQKLEPVMTQFEAARARQLRDAQQLERAQQQADQQRREQGAFEAMSDEQKAEYLRSKQATREKMWEVAGDVLDHFVGGSASSEGYCPPGSSRSGDACVTQWTVPGSPRSVAPSAPPVPPISPLYGEPGWGTRTVQ